MDDVDDIWNNGRAAEEDMADEDEEVEEDEEEVDAGHNDEEEANVDVEADEDEDDDDEDDDEGLGIKSGASETGNQDDDDEEDGNDMNSENASQSVRTSQSKGQEMEGEADMKKTDSEQREDEKKESNGNIENGSGNANGVVPADQVDQDVEMKDVSENGETKGEEANGGEANGEKELDATKYDKLFNYYTQMLRSAKICDNYNIYPTAAIPIQTDVNALAMSKGLKYLFLGGSDGFIRKYDFLNTMDGKLALTILQKHSLAESIQNAGILVSYWENEIPQKRSEIKFLKNNKEYEPKISPVYSLEVQSECLFLLSGLDNGGITLQGVRYMEGSIGHYFKGKEGHNNVVNLLRLNGLEDKFFSGSWDKRLLEWDLKTGGIVNEYKGGASEYSSIEMRPQYSSININDVAANLKSSSGKDQDDDDDMGSLFGDDEEEESNVRPDTEDSKTTKENLASNLDEISKTTLNVVYDESVFMTSGLNGSVHVWDRRTTNAPVLKLERGPKVPPWCQSACWAMDGDHIYVGRRNAIVEEFDLKNPTQPSNTLKLPGISGPVSCVKAMPNNRQILCASKDNVRIYDTKADFSKGSTIPFLIVPGHHGGSISNLYVDPTCRFLVSTSGTRGWQGNSTDTTFIYEIELE